MQDYSEVMDLRGRPGVVTVNDGESMTIQSDAHLADIANILKGYGVGEMERMLDDTEMQFADVSEFTDFHDVMIHARIAEVEFMKLPSKVREIFDHDVAVWLDTAHDEDKRNELVQAGFLEGEEVVVPVGGGEVSPEAGPVGGGAEAEAAGEETA